MSESKSTPAKITDFWNDHWEQKNTPWDLGAPHPGLTQLIESLQTLPLGLPKKIFIPGCGRAHESIVFHQLGMNVIGEDISAWAVNEAKQLYDREGIDFRVRDLFSPWPDDPVQGVYDRAMFCALPPTLRDRYVNAINQCTEVGSYLLAIPFTSLRNGTIGPPFEASESLWEKTWAPHWKTIWKRKIKKSNPTGSILEEMLYLGQRIT